MLFSNLIIKDTTQERLTIEMAKEGNLEGLRNAFDQEWSICPQVLVLSARQGNLECFKYLYNQISANDEYDLFWSFDLRKAAKEEGHQEIVNYLDEQKYEY